MIRAQTISLQYPRRWVQLALSMGMALAAGLPAGGCAAPDPFIRGTALVKCTVSREECLTYDRLNKLCFAVKAGVQPDFQGDVCYDSGTDTRKPDDICMERFCTPGPDAPGKCKALGVLVNNPGPLCYGATGGGLSNVVVSWTVHGESCPPDSSAQNCTLAPQNETHLDCESVRSAPVGFETLKAPPQAWASKAVHVEPIDISQTPCAIPQLQQRFQFGGTIATASAAGTSANIVATRGLTAFDQFCDSDGCFPADLLAFDADLADMTVAGTSLTNLSLSLTQAAPVTLVTDSLGNQFTGFAAGALQLRVVGRRAGVNSFYSVRNSSPWHLDSSTSAMHLMGSLNAVDKASNGGMLPVTINVDVSGTSATAQTLACASATGNARLFGFEDGWGWTATSSNGTLGLVTSPITQGCAAQSLKGSGFMTIDSAAFTTRGLVTNAATSVDLFVPPNQPNQFWQGQVQLYLSCPSGNFFHQFIGQSDVTGRPTNRFSTMRIPLTSAARTVLSHTHDDCSFQLALNVNSTGQAWVFDNFRFTP